MARCIAPHVVHLIGGAVVVLLSLSTCTPSGQPTSPTQTQLLTSATPSPDPSQSGPTPNAAVSSATSASASPSSSEGGMSTAVAASVSSMPALPPPPDHPPESYSAAEKQEWYAGQKQARQGAKKKKFILQVYGLAHPCETKLLLVFFVNGIELHRVSGCVVPSKVEAHARGNNQLVRYLVSKLHGKDLIGELMKRESCYLGGV